MTTLKDKLKAEINKTKSKSNTEDSKMKDVLNNKKNKQQQKYEEKDVETLVIEQKLNKLFLTMRDHLSESRAGLHASSIITPDTQFCFRAQLLSLFYEQTQGHDLSIGLLRIFAAGNSIHDKWQNMFKKSGIVIKNELRSFSEKYDLYFTPDSIVEINNTTYVAEIKSMNTFSFKHATSHPSGQKQCMLYMHLLGIEKGFVLAEDKNDQSIKIFPVKYDYHVILPFIDRLNEIQEMKKAFIERKEVPPRRCKTSSCKMAENCNMKDACFNIGIGRKRLKY